MIHMNVKAFLELQGGISDASFARKLGISRSQLWRIRTEKSAVGGHFIEKFMLSYPEKSISDYFFAETVPGAGQKGACASQQKNFFVRDVPLTAQTSDNDTVDGSTEK